MVVGLIPATMVTVSAGEVTPITGISIQGLSVPTVGDRIDDIYCGNLEESVAGSNKYEIINNQYATWKDEEGRSINYGQQIFEAGRTYSISIIVSPKDGYAFTSEDIPVEILNLYPYQYTSSVAISQESDNATVTFTFELSGERTYADIEEFHFYDIDAPKDGGIVQNVGLWAYNNSEMTDQYWADSNGTRLGAGDVFVGGSSYTYNFEFTAFDGYHFADDITIKNDTIKMNWAYSFNHDKTKIYITIPYDVGASNTVTSIVLEDMFLPVQGDTTRDFSTGAYIHVSENASYQIFPQTLSWFEPEATFYNDTSNKVSETGFIAGKQYKMFCIVSSKDGYKFGSPQNVSVNFAGISDDTYTYTVLEGSSENNVVVAAVFTAQFPENAGTINNPVVCTNYTELKYALEHPTIQGIVVNSFTNSPYQSFYTLERETDFEKGHCAITIPTGATKYLTINTDINIRAPYIDYLLYSFIDNRGSLSIAGNGSLNVSMNARGYPSAILFNNGDLEINGSVTFDPSNKSFDSVHGYSIFQSVGTTNIYSGTFIGYATSAVSYMNGTMNIYGGTFNVKNGDEDAFGLNTDGYLTIEEHDVNLYGGTFEGIRAEQSVGADQVKLRDLLAYGAYYAYTEDDAKFNPSDKIETKETLTVKMNPLINEVSLTITAPKDHSTPSYNVGSASEYYSMAKENDVDASEFVCWYESIDGESWTEMETSAQFRAGYYYRVTIDVMTLKNALFELYYDGSSFQPDVTAYVNGNTAIAKKMTMVDPSYDIRVEYDFGLLNDTVIESIIITDVIAPVAGEYPSYTCNLQGTGYHLATYKDKNYDAYWVGEQWPIIKNGMGWWDVTANDWHYGNKTFVFGHEYKLCVYIQTDDGYELYTSGNDYTSLVTAKINGQNASLEKVNMASYEQTAEYTFTCAPKIIKEIELTGIDVPVAGEKPDFDAIVGLPEYYQLDTSFGVGGFMWYKDNADEMTEEDVFEDLEEYRLVIRLIPVEVNGEEACKFHDTRTTATINGNPVKKQNGRWDEASASPKRVQLFYTFVMDEIMLNKGATVSGEVTSFHDEKGEITLHLIAEGESNPSYEVIVKGNSAEYAIEGVADGNYTLRATKAYHLVAEKEITVSGDTVQDIALVLGNDGKQFKFNSAYLNLTQDINFVYVATIPEGFTNPYVVFTMNGKNHTVTESTLDDRGRNCFKFLGVNPHWMGDNISATVYATVGDIEVSFTQANYSIKQYCKNQLSKTTDNELKALLSDLLVYGEKAQSYQNYKTGELVTADMTLYPSTFVTLGAEYNKQTVIGDKNATIDYGGAGLYLSNNVAIRYTINTFTPEKYTYEITIKGNTRTFTAADLQYVSEGKYYLFFDGIMATEFDEVVTAQIKQDGVLVGRTIEYSVNTYIQKYQDDASTLGALLRAVHNYGNSATAYAD
ncbi:MAG: hypothetical protein IJW09_05460 [Clostridia bacterium]|nr:hypothetical protein [Clostridia bacterium]